MPLLFVHYSNMILTLQSIGFGICLASMWIDVLFFWRKYSRYFGYIFKMGI